MVKAIVNGVILLPEEEIRGKALLYDTRVAAICGEEEARREAGEVLDAEGAYIAPGFMDTHIHGYGGDDVSDHDPQGVRRIAIKLVENGVTAFLPTTLTVAWDTLAAICADMRALARESRQPDFPGAEIAGVHLEGPFIQPKRKGAQNERYILPPDAEKVLPYADIVRVLTFAPEMPGSGEMMDKLKKSGVALSMGHTDATFEQAMAAVAGGVSRCTHLFNAMTGLHHRNPGVVGAALNAPVYTELIADTFHVHPGIFPMLARLKGKYLVLITDALRAAGLPDGTYENGGQTFFLRGIECRLQDGTIAGSVLKMNEAVKNLRDYGGVSLCQAVCAASRNAAESVGLGDRKGSLTPGKDADIVLLDQNCRVLKTIVRGVCKYTAPDGPAA